MRIALFDLTPVLWGMCAAAAILLALRGDWGAAARTLPAVCAAALLYFLCYPPRVQALGFTVFYVCDALCWAVLQHIAARRRVKRLHKAKTDAA